MKKNYVIPDDTMMIVATIIHIVEKEYKMKEGQIRRRNKSYKFCEPRQVAMSLIRQFTFYDDDHRLPFAAIGSCFRHMDHASVYHACKVVNNLKFSNKEFAERLKRIHEQCDEAITSKTFFS